ncbi:MAG: hypothetical protein H6742_03830 [Alphaproteobacteria bacterium]|nr:hypothetical protein [Alphaproteobacteria bacterium]
MTALLRGPGPSSPLTRASLIGLAALLAGCVIVSTERRDACETDDDCDSTRYCEEHSSGNTCTTRSVAGSLVGDSAWAECAGLVTTTDLCAECVDDAGCAAAASTAGRSDAELYRCVPNPDHVDQRECIAQAVAEDCATDLQCRTGDCDETRRVCAGECEAHTDCATGEYCSATICLPAKPSGSYCTDPEACTDGRCEDGFCIQCATSDECGSGEQCVAGSCVPECAVDAVLLDKVSLIVDDDAVTDNPHGFADIWIDVTLSQWADLVVARKGRPGAAEPTVISGEGTGDLFRFPWWMGTGPLYMTTDTGGGACATTIQVPELTAAQRTEWSVPDGWL